MLTFSATAFNGDGLTFRITFQNQNWCGVVAAGEKALAAIVAADPMHQANGPWSLRNIDRTA